MAGKIIKTIFTLLLLGLIVGGGYFLISRNQQAPVQFATIMPQRGDVIKKAVASGSIEPRHEVAIKPRVSGVVEVLHVEPGQLVERGSLIAKIQIVPDAVTLNSAQARVESARISHKNAQRALERYRQLFSQKLISRGEYDRYRYDHDLMSEELKGAQSNLVLIREGGNGEAGTVSNEIRSTVAGTVLDISIKKGESVTETNNFNEGTTIAAIADMTDMVFIGTVDESEVGRIGEGMALRISIGAIEGVVYDGVLEFISPKGKKEEGSVQFEIRAAITSLTDNTIRAGYSANADVVLDRRDDVLTIDERVLRFEDNKILVDVQTGEGSPQSFTRREIQTGLSDGIKIEVLDGIAADDKIKVP